MGVNKIYRGLSNKSGPGALCLFVRLVTAGMNIAFSKIIKINGRLWEFNFRKYPAAADNFHVDVTDEKGRRLFFNLQKTEGGSWSTPSAELPEWVRQSETLLGSVIEESVK